MANNKCSFENPYETLTKNFKIPYYTQLGPGPCNSSEDVMQALTCQPVTFMNEYFYKVMNDIKEMIKYIYQTSNYFTVVAQTSGNGGNEAMVTNLADPGDTILVAVAGVWGLRVADMGRRYNLNVIELTKEAGEVYNFEELEDAIIKNRPVALFVTHGESTGGTEQPLDGLGDICHKYDCLLAVDAVMSLAVAPILVDQWKIDAANGATQKGIGVPTGMCFLTFSTKAHQRMLSKKHKPPYIYDMLTMGDMWKCFGNARRYIYTYGTHMLVSIRQALHNICQEGLENVWERHRKASELFINEIEKLGMKHFIEKPENRFHGVVMVVLPNGVDWKLLLSYVMEKYKIEFGFGVGPTAGKSLRISFISNNANPNIVKKLVEALRDGINYCRNNPNDVHDCLITRLQKEWNFAVPKKINLPINLLYDE